MEPVYLIAPIAVAGAIACSVVYTRHRKHRVAEDGVEVILTEQWGAAFRLGANEQLCTFWKGQLYEGPAIPEYHDELELEDQAQRPAPQAASSSDPNVRHLKVQVYLGLTTRGRLVVGRSAQRGPEDHEITPHSEWVPGSELYFAHDLALSPGRPPLMENGYRGRPYFLLLGNEPGTRLPVWIPENAAAEIAAWRMLRTGTHMHE